VRTIAHFEIPSTDLKRSAAFYEALFGWRIEPLDDNYTMLLMGEDESGGLYRTETIKPSMLALYFTVEDIPATLEKAVALGGVVIDPKRSIGEHGYIGAFRDPLGVRIDLWSKS